MITHGKLLRYDPQPHKNEYAHRANVEDRAEWRVKIAHPTEFKVEILQVCGKGQWETPSSSNFPEASASS